MAAGKAAPLQLKLPLPAAGKPPEPAAKRLKLLPVSTAATNGVPETTGRGTVSRDTGRPGYGNCGMAPLLVRVSGKRRSWRPQCNWGIEWFSGCYPVYVWIICENVRTLLASLLYNSTGTWEERATVDLGQSHSVCFHSNQT